MKQEDKYRILPDISQEEFEALKKDIEDRGVLIPIETDEYGNILDGFIRNLICKELGIKDVPTVVRVGLTEEQKIEHILRMNFARRHLSKGEKKLALQVRARGWSQERIAIDLGVSQKTISNWLDPEFSKFPELTAVIGKDGKRYPARRLKEEPEGQEQKESGDNEDAGIRLLLDDPHERGHQIQERSVDLILTRSPGDDPQIWAELAILAKRVLKPEKLLVLCTGQERLPEGISALSKRLQYVWTGTLVLKDTSAISAIHVDSDTKLVLFFAAPPYEPGPWFYDTFVDKGIDGTDGMEGVLIEQLTSRGNVIFDPFDSDMVAIAAEQLERGFIRIKKDTDAFTKANEADETSEPPRLQWTVNSR